MLKRCRELVMVQVFKIGFQKWPWVEYFFYASWTRLFFISCQIFAVFDDFSKWGVHCRCCEILKNYQIWPKNNEENSYSITIFGWFHIPENRDLGSRSAALLEITWLPKGEEKEASWCHDLAVKSAKDVLAFKTVGSGTRRCSHINSIYSSPCIFTKIFKIFTTKFTILPSLLSVIYLTRIMIS